MAGVDMRPREGDLYKHLKRGSIYKVWAISKSSVDGSEWVVYQEIAPFPTGGQWWHRPLAEFMDGRFEERPR